MGEIVLAYRRDSGELSTGRVYYKEGTEETALSEFSQEDFKRMLQKYASALQSYPDARAVWLRTDRAGLVPYYLDDVVTSLFRTDPVAAIASMSPQEASPSLAVRRVREERKRVPLSIRAGYEVLSDAFGEELYTRFRLGRLECFGCGVWAELDTASTFQCRNPNCAFASKRHTVRVVAKWAIAPTEYLLGVSSWRYFLPRAWNNNRPWIGWKELTKSYQDFVDSKRRLGNE